MRNLFARLFLLSLMFLPVAAHAQAGATVVATCGTLGQNYAQGSVRPLTQTTAGLLCTNASGGGGGGTSSTFGAAFPTDGTAIGMSQGGNMVALTGTAGSLNVNITGGSGTTGAVTMASGAVASGAYSSGAIASGAYASGSIGSGAMVDLGAIADAASSAGGTGTVSAKLRLMTTQLDTINTTLGGDIPNVTVGNIAPAAATATKSLMMAGQYSSTQPTYTNGQQGAINLSARGAQLVTPGVENFPVINGGSTYETVAASQTGQILGGAGAIGDYLSHCVIYPQTTTPGVVTVFDDTTGASANVIAFPGGASSVSNLAPIPIPVGAVSVTGEWRVTTGANVIVTCYGKFT